MKTFRVELIWNREFCWSLYGNDYDTMKSAKEAAISIRDSGDGARVKEARVIDNQTEKVVWNG